MPIINLVYEAPEGWKYSYDFTTGSVADFSSQGWTVPSSIRIDNNGMTATNTWSAPIVYMPGLNTALQTTKKIHYEFTYTQSNTGSFQHGLNVTNSNPSNLELNLYGDGRWVEIVVGETFYVSGNKTAITPGTYTRQFDVDLVNKTLEYSIDGRTTGSNTITDTDITNLKTGINLSLACSYNGYIKNFNIIIS